MAFSAMPGCAEFSNVFRGSSSGSKSIMETYAADDFPSALNGQIAADIAERLEGGYPPGQTKLHLTVYLVGRGKGQLNQAVEDILRTRGFAILPQPQDDAVNVAFRLDKIDERTWYLTVSLSSGYRFARVYDFDGKILKPVGLLSQGAF
ncbi:MAG: hypothetical protein LBP22_00500 [Deltaproteobacteria bacterium]|nr:hypothetical protein [Deltaproteobacteria bacterium]